MKIGLALGGGVGYGFAHIGVLKALEKHGIKPDFIAGTSVGSLVGGLYASGLSIEEIEKIAMEFKWTEVLQFTIPKDGLISLDKVEKFVSNYCGVENIEDTKIKFAAVATNLLRGTEDVFTEGPIAGAIRASCSLPGIFTPAHYNNAIYVDGGIVDNLPVDVVKSMGADFIIGVDITAKARLDVLKGRDIFSVVWKSLQIMIQENTSYKAYGNADIIIMPAIGDVNPFDLGHRDKIIKKGEIVIEKEIGNIRKKMQKNRSFKGRIRRIFSKK